ncbi:hypothetical protein SprV_0301082200 [Sparganum proliferum]
MDVVAMGSPPGLLLSDVFMGKPEKFQPSGQINRHNISVATSMKSSQLPPSPPPPLPPPPPPPPSQKLAQLLSLMRRSDLQWFPPCLVARSRQYPPAHAVELVTFLQRVNNDLKPRVASPNSALVLAFVRTELSFCLKRRDESQEVVLEKETRSLGQESLAFQHRKPKFWARYADDTFVIIERDQVLTFQEHLNAVFTDIQFTMEEEENNQLAFLDVLVCRKDCGGLKTEVFRKATNTMQVLNFNSNHPISHKRSCVMTLYRRVETHCSEPEDKIAELQYLRRVFKANGYPRNFVNRCIRKRDERPNHTDTKSWRALPYVKNVSEAVGRLLAPRGVRVAHRPEATIRRLVMKPKDPLPRLETSGVVYRMWCSCGQGNYVGETGRQLRTRMAKHAAAVRRNDASSQVAAHSTRFGHTFKFDEDEILARGDNRMSRELLESWFTGPQSINKCNELPLPYSVLRLRLGGVIGHAGSAQVNTLPNTRVGASDGRAIITPAPNARDEIAAVNDANVGHNTTCNDPG